VIDLLKKATMPRARLDVDYNRAHPSEQIGKDEASGAADIYSAAPLI